jgi:large subunit ribosomal protein L3
MQGLIGKKLGMTQVYDQNGQHVPVTVIQVGPCVVLQRKNSARDGYEAIQVGYSDQKEQRMTKLAFPPSDSFANLPFPPTMPPRKAIP